MAEIKRVYTLDEVAEIMQVTKRTLYNYIKAGSLHAVKMGKYWRVSEENLQAFISTGTPIVDANKRPESQLIDKSE
jgi:excisionase family DNA binding protein